MADVSPQTAAFLELCAKDKEFCKELRSKNDQEIVEAAAGKGFEITQQDLENLLETEATDQELSSSDLELVAGGAKALNAVSDGLVCNTIRSLATGESGCGGFVKNVRAKFDT